MQKSFLANDWIIFPLNIRDSLKKGGISQLVETCNNVIRYHRVIQLCLKMSQDTKVKMQRFSRPERLGVLPPGPLPLPCCPPSRSGLGGGTWAARRSAGCTARSWTAAASRELAGMGCRGRKHVQHVNLTRREEGSF